MTECELLQAYGETCEAVEDGLPTWASLVLVGVAFAVIALFQWLGRSGRLGPLWYGDDDDRYCDHEYDSYCGRCGLAAED